MSAFTAATFDGCDYSLLITNPFQCILQASSNTERSVKKLRPLTNSFQAFSGLWGRMISAHILFQLTVSHVGKVFQSLDVHADNSNLIIHIYGGTKCENSVLVRVHNFKHYFYIAAPVGFGEEDLEPFKDELNVRLCETSDLGV
ncbi:hypothetical protein M422DRAFT_49667 [Sphaerobolus stellatus SS14]|uniref:Uncharacterized protein n=1 Tax=Sphaerobolus stellatus (strain SS14) TaxID=990650 RepID=A0A0C9VCL0_SPHS4|nr:hypothetical protein M422DRAFT_49667 [Sphaerobolus stellatus SS14]